jgi:hypothetical protein
MDFTYDEGDRKFRQEVREFIAKTLPLKWRAESFAVITTS